jgi:hypothetical protein
VFPDGMLPGDSISFAALSNSQNVVRFANSVKIDSFALLFVEGPDALTGEHIQFTASSPQISPTHQAKLSFFFGKPFQIRPEALSVASIFASGITDDFAAYAQQKGLSVCWVGCQIPRPEPVDCPGLPSSSTCSCE